MYTWNVYIYKEQKYSYNRKNSYKNKTKYIYTYIHMIVFYDIVENSYNINTYNICSNKVLLITNNIT